MPKLAIFFLDAVRFSDVNFQKTPFLAKLSREGLAGPLETLLAYEGLAATLFSGVHPSRHGVWTRYYSDPQRSPFRWLSPFTSLLDTLNGTRLLSRPIRYEVMQISKAVTGFSYFPGLDCVPFQQLAQMSYSLKHNVYDPGCLGNVPTLFDILRKEKVSFGYIDHGIFDSDESVFRKALSSKAKADVMIVRLVDLDTISHEFGLQSREKLRALRQTDFFVERIVSRWREKDPDLATICFADHGMVSVDSYVDVSRLLREDGLRPFRDFGMFLDSTMARFWGDDEVLEQIGTVLSRLDCGRILSEKDRDAYHIPLSSLYGQLLMLLRPGSTIFPSHFETRKQIKAMHGYDPKTPGLDTVFVLQSDAIQPKRLEGARMVDVLPTILDLLNVEIPAHCEGRSLRGA